MSNVVVVIGAGSIGQAIARRVSAGKHVLLADRRQEKAVAAAKALKDAGYEVSVANARLPSIVSAPRSIFSRTRSRVGSARVRESPNSPGVM